MVLSAEDSMLYLDKLLLPYKFNGSGIEGILFSKFARRELLSKVKVLYNKKKCLKSVLTHLIFDVTTGRENQEKKILRFVLNRGLS